MTEQPPPHPPSLDIVYAEVKERLNAQLQQVESLDTKAGTVLSVASIVMTLGAGLGVTGEDLSDTSLALVIGSAVTYAMTMFFGFRSYWLRNFRRDPQPGPLRDSYLFQPTDFTKRRLIASMVESFEDNQPLVESKVWNMKLAISLLAIQTSALVSGLIIEMA